MCILSMYDRFILQKWTQKKTTTTTTTTAYCRMYLQTWTNENNKWFFLGISTPAKIGCSIRLPVLLLLLATYIVHRRHTVEKVNGSKNWNANRKKRMATHTHWHLAHTHIAHTHMHAMSSWAEFYFVLLAPPTFYTLCHWSDKKTTKKPNSMWMI